jgi:hypothetical protein
MQTAEKLPIALPPGKEAASRPITVSVNGRAVSFQEHKATGAEIKATAIRQGVPIHLDFALFEVQGHGSLKPIGDNDEVTLHPNQEFRAVAPDDNS